MVSPEFIYSKVEDLIGVPFKYNGRDPKRALDCWGLLMELHRRIYGIELPDYILPVKEGQDEVPEVARLMAADQHLWQETPEGPGASILCKINGLGAHVGMQVDDTRFIHTWEKSNGVTITPLSFWRNGKRDSRIIGFYRYVG